MAWQKNHPFKQGTQKKKMIPVVLCSKSSEALFLCSFQIIQIGNNDTACKRTPDPPLTKPLPQHSNHSITLLGRTITPNRYKTREDNSQQIHNVATNGQTLLTILTHVMPINHGNSTTVKVVQYKNLTQCISPCEKCYLSLDMSLPNTISTKSS